MLDRIRDGIQHGQIPGGSDALEALERLRSLTGPIPPSMLETPTSEYPPMPPIVQSHLDWVTGYARGLSYVEIDPNTNGHEPGGRVKAAISRICEDLQVHRPAELLLTCYENRWLNPYEIADFDTLRPRFNTFMQDDKITTETKEKVIYLLSGILRCRSTVDEDLAQDLSWSDVTIRRHVLSARNAFGLPEVHHPRNLLVAVAYCAQQEGLLNSQNLPRRR